MTETLTILPADVSYRLEQTPSGWHLTMRNAHCTLSQVFHSSTTAQQAIAAGAAALESLTNQHLTRAGRG